MENVRKKKTFLNILGISLIGILLVPIRGSAHKVGGDNPPEEVHRVIEVLFRLDSEDVHGSVKHNRNNYGAPRWFAATPCDGYEGGHAGYDVAHEDDDARFYSLTDGEVINVVHPTKDIKDLSYIAVYNEEHNKTIFYLHPSRIYVEEEDIVKVGTTRLGRQGNTGNSKGHHVHLEIRSGEWKNPSCGVNPILSAHRHHPNEDPISFLFEQIGDGGDPPSTDKPDLVIASIKTIPATLGPGVKFRLYATLKNQGTADSEATTLRYYRSTNDRITDGDKQVGWGHRDPLAPNKTIRRYLPLTVPTTPGTYYYGVCVDPVANEADTGNNCSEAIKVTVGSPNIAEDVNGDGVVNIEDLVIVAEEYGQEGDNVADVNGDEIVDIKDLILVAEAIDEAAAAPTALTQVRSISTVEQRQEWLTEVKARQKRAVSHQRGLALLERLFTLASPKKTMLLPNYPNPFNPETWIPYHLSKETEVVLTIHDVRGVSVRALRLGHQSAGIYESRGRAAYWDGKNQIGEPVASGLYFYTLTTGEFTATRKLLIVK